MGIVACNKGSSSQDRWYSEEEVAIGSKIFASNCVSCHGKRAEGITENWKVRFEDGSLPPPPLNGSAHAWHHPLPLLLQIVQQGGALYDGTMPGFGNSLSEEEQYAVIAWFQSLWDDETYGLWDGGKKPVGNGFRSQGEQ